MAVLLLLLLVSLALLQRSQAQSDPCGSYSLIFNEFKRSADYSTAEGELDLCDNALSPGWYRFDGGAGGDLLDVSKCHLGFCGTVFPVCLKDFLGSGFPAPEAGEVTRTACRKAPSGCGAEWPITVKNCGSFRVYRLAPSDACPSAYCVGEGVLCPPGQCSETGFTPCSPHCPMNVSLSPVVVPGQEIDGNTGLGVIVFRCQFTPPPAHPGLLYDVHWYVNDKPVAKFTALPSDRVGLDGRLQEAAWKHVGLGMVVKCSLRARYNETLPPAQHFYSQPFFAGLELERKEIAVREGDSATVNIRSTVPTPSISFRGQQRGTLFVLGFTPRDQSQPDFGQNDVIFSTQRCGVGIPSLTWNDWHNLSVSPGVDARYQNSRISLLRLGVESDLSDTNGVWTNMTVPDVKVVITDEDRQLSGKTCISHNDPHMTTFNGRHYENQNEGEFILYEHAVYPVSVHVKYAICKIWPWATCNCAVAIRAYDSLLVVDRCKDSAYATAHVNHISYTHCDDRYLLIEKEGDTYKVRLPTGTLVKFSLGQDFLSGVFMTPSPADISQTRGLCGQLHPDVPNMDLVLRDGTATGDVARFIEDWRITNRSESLFIENPVLVYKVPVQPYCFCNNNDPTKLKNSIDCSLPYTVAPEQQRFSPNLEAFLHSCKGRTRRDLRTSDYVTDGPSGWTGEARHSRKKRSVLPEWRDGWTEEKARNHCREAFERSAGVALMEEATGFTAWKEYLVETCVLDIKYTADTYYTNISVEVFKGICKTEVEKNVTLLETEVGRTLVAEIANASCPLDCSGHGVCNQGECQCGEGHKGVDCSVDTSLPPDTPYIPQGGLCNTRQRACQSTPVLAANLPETGAVFCGFRPFQIRADGVHHGSQWSVTVAEPWTQGQVQCPFPRHVVRRQAQGDVMADGYNVSLSNNNVTYSSEVAVVIYDADCMNCSADTLTCVTTAQCDSTTGSTNTTPSTTTTTAPTTTTTAPTTTITTAPTTTTTAPTTTTTTKTTTATTPSKTIATTPATSSDPCSSYTLISDEPERSLGYVTSAVRAHLCDRVMLPLWYRFESGAGGDLQPMSSCSLGSCGTVHPVCLKDGAVPTEAAGEVTLQVCRLGTNNGHCAAEWSIKAKNCGLYRVYFLRPTDSCSSAYCVGTEVACSPGQCSPNGFTPGCTDCPTSTSTSTSTTKPADSDQEPTERDNQGTEGDGSEDSSGEAKMETFEIVLAVLGGAVLGGMALSAVLLLLKAFKGPAKSVAPAPDLPRPATARSIGLDFQPDKAT